MDISIFSMFSVGIGPSSSHTVGPMRASKAFIDYLIETQLIQKTAAIQIVLYGSLAFTGVAHGTDKALILGLEGNRPETIDAEEAKKRFCEIKQGSVISLGGIHEIKFSSEKDLVFDKGRFLPLHSNGMQFWAYDESGKNLFKETLYSVGGGFIATDKELKEGPRKLIEEVALPYPFSNAKELLDHCLDNDLSMKEVILQNELKRRSREEISEQVLKYWTVMKESIERGCRTEGVLPGGLNVARRAPDLYKTLKGSEGKLGMSEAMEWLSLYALAVNEENAAGHRVVTAPTNGAAGVVPAVGSYLFRHEKKSEEVEDLITYFLVCGAIGTLYKKNASIAAAEMGCQGEVGVACSMAAAGYCAVLGGTPQQIQIAAEIGMEHNLGLTCDPVAGLVQIPCIERNTMGAVKAVTAALLALKSSPNPKVSLDQVIETMKHTGHDMNSIYKETSQGGLAVNVVEC